jgi:hypothetical protein
MVGAISNPHYSKVNGGEFCLQITYVIRIDAPLKFYGPADGDPSRAENSSPAYRMVGVIAG